MKDHISEAYWIEYETCLAWLMALGHTPEAVQKIAATTVFKDFTVMLRLHFEDEDIL